MLWYRLTSDGSQPVPPDQYRMRAQTAANGLMLNQRSDLRSIRDRDDGAILLFTRDAHYLCLPYDDEQRGRDAADTIGRACRAHTEPCDPPAILDEHLRFAHTVVPWTARLQRTGRETDTTEARILPPGDGYTAINLRRLGFVESNRIENWIADEYNSQADSSELRGAGVAACRIVSASRRQDDAERACVQAAGMIGTGLQTFRTHTDQPATLLPILSLIPLALGVIGLWAPIPWWWPAIGTGATGLLAALTIPKWRHPMLTGILTGLTLGLGAATGVLWWTPASYPCLALGAMGVTGGLIRRLFTGRDGWAHILTRPRHWLLPFPRYRAADSADRKTRVGGDNPNTPDVLHAYPMHRSTLLLKPTALAAALTPIAAKGSETGVTEAPRQLLDATGPMVGRDARNNPVRLPENRLWEGVAIVGKPGSGKSNLVHGLLGWVGEQSGAVIDFEMSGLQAASPLRRLMPDAKPLRMAAGTGPVIDPSGTGNPGERGRRFADLMRRALSEGEFGQRSMMQVRAATTISLILHADHKDRLEPMGLADQHWLVTVGVLLGREGIPRQRMLARIASQYDPDDIETLQLGETTQHKPLVPDSRLADLFGAPMNKIDQLLSQPDMWDPKRPTVTWQWILEHDLQVIIDPDCGDARTTSLIGGMLFNGLKDQIMDTCEGWRDQGRKVTIACDELSLMAATSPDTVEWFREQGRKYGVQCVYATQNLEQMSPRLASSLIGFGNLLSFQLLSAEAAASVSQALDGGRGEWTPSRIMSLPKHTAALRTSGDNGLLPVTVLRIPDYDHNPQP